MLIYMFVIFVILFTFAIASDRKTYSWFHFKFDASFTIKVIFHIWRIKFEECRNYKHLKFISLKIIYYMYYNDHIESQCYRDITLLFNLLCFKLNKRAYLFLFPCAFKACKVFFPSDVS